MTLQISSKRIVRDICIDICLPDNGSLVFGARRSNPRCATVMIIGDAPDNGSNGVAILQCIIEAF